MSYRVFQRDGATGDITITGSLREGSGTRTIQARWNGGEYVTIAAGATPGDWSGVLANQAGGQGTLDVTDGQTTISIPYVGVGEVFAVAGQSNASGRGTNNQTYSHATLKAVLFDNNWTWREMTDPTDVATGEVDAFAKDTNAGGSPWPKFVTDAMADQGVPVAIVPCARGSSWLKAWAGVVGITRHWGPHVNFQLYENMETRITAVGAVRAVIYYQMEAEAGDATLSAADINAALDDLANNVAADFGVPLVVTKIHNNGGANLAAVWSATDTAIADNANVKAGADLSDQEWLPDAQHATTDEQLTLVGARTWTAVKAALGL